MQQDASAALFIACDYYPPGNEVIWEHEGEAFSRVVMRRI